MCYSCFGALEALHECEGSFNSGPKQTVFFQSLLLVVLLLLLLLAVLPLRGSRAR